MDQKTKETVEKKMKDGWIKAMMMIEVLATSKKAAKDALEKHVKKMHNEEGLILYREDYKDIVKVDKPMPHIKTAHSYIVELELIVRSYDRLVYVTMNYGPTSIEILEPTEIRIKMGEAQIVLNVISELMHKFAAAGIGGMVVST